MSGGYFDYVDHHFADIANSIQEEIESNNLPYGDEYSDKYFHENGDKRFSDKTIQFFEEGLKLIRQAAVYAHEIDYLLCGDTSEETMEKNIVNKLKELSNKNYREQLDKDTD